MRIVVFALWLIASSATAAQSLRVVDDFGREVALPAPASRIVSLGPHITENLFSAGAGGKIVGVVDHSDYPPQAKKIQSVGGGYSQINLEAVIALAPDLVVAWRTQGNAESIEKIAQLGYAVYYSDPRDFEGVIENIEKLATLAGTADAVSPTPQKLRDELTQLRAQFAESEVQTVFYQIWRAPLMTLNGAHYISRVLELCGARNVFAELPITAPRVSVEAVLDANPDIIIAGRGDGWETDMSKWKKWHGINAVKFDNFISVDGPVMHRPTARMIMGIREVCEGIDRTRRNKN